MTRHVRIFRPAKTAMQSGRGKIRDWIMTFEPTGRVMPDPIIGWAGSGDTARQVRLAFETKEEAIAYARKEGYTYTVREAKERRINPKAYADNFAFTRREPWTH
ncbi:MAG: ETC complex I subunit [Alphaproteobacteria bacterium]|nr:ETC complex I subunit [Alphaproteobacteria bacterium]